MVLSFSGIRRSFGFGVVIGRSIFISSGSCVVQPHSQTKMETETVAGAMVRATEPFKETFKTVHEVPTKVVCHGRSIDDDLKDVKFLVLVFPGNPGVVDYYKEFMLEMYDGLASKYPETPIPVWGISHAGHQRGHLEKSLFPSLQENENLYSLEGQFNHKLEFVKEFIPGHIKVIGVGHSIGCKTWTELMKRMDQIKTSPSGSGNGSGDVKLPEIAQCYMLFPTLEKMRASPNGIWMTQWLPYYKFMQPALHLITSLPTFVHRAFLKFYFWGKSVPNSVLEASLQLFHRDVWQSTLYMGKCEMEQVWDLDVETINKNLNKLFFYFGKTDGWVPLSQVEEMKQTIPNMKFQVCENGFEHAFVINRSQEMAEILTSMIDIENL